MYDKKTRLGKVQSENRKLKRENDNLKIAYKELEMKLAEISEKEEKENKYSFIKNLLLFIYDIVVPMLILVFTYNSSSGGNLDVSTNLMVILILLIWAKCLFENEKFSIKSVGAQF